MVAVPPGEFGDGIEDRGFRFLRRLRVGGGVVLRDLDSAAHRYVLVDHDPIVVVPGGPGEGFRGDFSVRHDPLLRGDFLRVSSQAVRQLWARAKIVHDATPSLRADASSHGGYIPATLDNAMTTAESAGIALGLSSTQQARLRDILEEYFQASPLARQVVNHGDLALMNALWCGEIIALLDFEFAVLGPVEIDL
ncbi:phosphotransferase [Auritidibacter ignavus]|uniref:phosphotransferase n=1 Tax=Auritidibacter ignavus TaxID=678932 RepID=UPI003211D56E